MPKLRTGHMGNHENQLALNTCGFDWRMRSICMIEEEYMTYRNPETRWHALYVRKRFEACVAVSLKTDDVEHYLPLRQLTAPGEPRQIKLPVFSGILFVKCSSRKAAAIRLIPGVLIIQPGTALESETLEQDISNLRLITDTG